VAKSTIDKDWVLGHFIDAIFSVPKCKESLIFKGGTCLRKCYFPGYRFSEELDFTSSDRDFELDRKTLNKITGLVTKRTAIPLHIQELSPLQFKDRLTGYKATIRFWGADHSRNQAPPPPERWTTSIKIEIILFEQMVFPVEMREVYHPYSDQLSEKHLVVPCYSVNEVLAEKLRALIQRSYTAPRDFYDIWYLSQNAADLNWAETVEAFHQKMKFKGLEFTGIDQMINDENDKRLQVAWKNSLGHQIAGDRFAAYSEIKVFLEKLLQTYFS
jgi:predicted nucleotidyltransferase component of viral defense system